MGKYNIFYLYASEPIIQIQHIQIAVTTLPCRKIKILHVCNKIHEEKNTPPMLPYI